MDHIPRYLERPLQRQLSAGDKVVVVYGPRQVGKTTLIHRIIEDNGYKTLTLTGDDVTHIEALATPELQRLNRITEGYELLFVDEAQGVPEIGRSIKLLHDHKPDLRIVLSGSSSLQLAGRTKEALTGRSREYLLTPIWSGELRTRHTPFELDALLADRLVYGDYPEVRTAETASERWAAVQAIAASYLFKDILDLTDTRYPEALVQLTRLLAFQIGSEVSYDELARNVGLSRESVQRYITLLEQSYVVFRVYGFSRNLRKEVTRKPKIYFWDVGIRNALIDRGNPIDRREDTGALWENFLIVERRTANAYTERPCHLRFWRVYTGAEIDLIEECGHGTAGFEITWSSRRAKRAPSLWTETYPEASFTKVSRNNWLEFVQPR